MKMTYLFELISCYEVVVATLFNLFLGSRGVADLPFEYSLVLLQYFLDQCILSNTGWTDNDDGLSFQWSWVERAEVLFGEDKNIILHTNRKRLLIARGLNKRMGLSLFVKSVNILVC